MIQLWKKMKEHSSKIDIAYNEKPMADEVLGFFYQYSFRPNTTELNYFYIQCSDLNEKCWDYGFCSSECIGNMDNARIIRVAYIDKSTIITAIEDVLSEFVRRQKLVESKKKMDRLNRDFE